MFAYPTLRKTREGWGTRRISAGMLKAVVGLRPSFSAHIRWCERRAPRGSRGSRERLEGWACGIPHLAKNERDAPNFLFAALERTACAALNKESRMKFRETTKLHRKSGMWGIRHGGGGWSKKTRRFALNLLPDHPLNCSSALFSSGFCGRGSGRTGLCPGSIGRKRRSARPVRRCDERRQEYSPGPSRPTTQTKSLSAAWTPLSYSRYTSQHGNLSHQE
jgi:hypothetical protein